MMTVKEYAKHVDADPRTVRGWMRDGLLRFIQPDGHRARLIDSAQPRPKKKGTKSTHAVKQNIRPAVNVPRQADRRPANVPRQADRRTVNVISQPRERISRLPGNPAFERLCRDPVVSPDRRDVKKKLESLKLEPVKHKAVSLEPVSDNSDDSDNWFTSKRLIGIVLLLWALPKLLPKILSQIR